MSTEKELFLKLKKLPAKQQEKVHDYVDFLSSESKRNKLNQQKRKAGLAKGLIKISEDFDEPLEDFEKYMQ